MQERGHAASPASLFRECCALLRNGDPAAQRLLPFLDQHAGYAPGWLELGRTLLALRKFDAALIAFGRALAAAPALTAARLGRAGALSALGRPVEAAAAFAEAGQMAPDDRTIPYRAGCCLRDAARFGEACAAFERALALDPGFAEAWFALGATRQDLHDPTGAAAAYRAALAARPDLHEAALNLGIACQDAGEMEAALNAYAHALRLRPEAFGRIAQALTSGPTGALWLSLSALRDDLAARA